MTVVILSTTFVTKFQVEFCRLSLSFLACNSRLHSAVRRPHPPQRLVLGHIHCFRQSEIVGISDPAVWCSAMWCGGVLVVSSSPLAGELTGSSWHLHYCPKRVEQRDWAIYIEFGCPISFQTSLFQTNWCHVIPNSIRRQHWSKASIFQASLFESAQQSDP